MKVKFQMLTQTLINVSRSVIHLDDNGYAIGYIMNKGCHNINILLHSKKILNLT